MHGRCLTEEEHFFFNNDKAREIMTVCQDSPRQRV